MKGVGDCKNSEAVFTCAHTQRSSAHSAHTHHLLCAPITKSPLFTEEPIWQELGFGALCWGDMRNGKSR